VDGRALRGSRRAVEVTRQSTVEDLDGRAHRPRRVLSRIRGVRQFAARALGCPGA
jgi:hypothetical protein